MLSSEGGIGGIKLIISCYYQKWRYLKSRFAPKRRRRSLSSPSPPRPLAGAWRPRLPFRLSRRSEGAGVLSQRLLVARAASSAHGAEEWRKVNSNAAGQRCEIRNQYEIEGGVMTIVFVEGKL